MSVRSLNGLDSNSRSLNGLNTLSGIKNKYDFNGSVSNGSLLIGNSSTGLFETNNLTAGANVSITNSSGNISIATTGLISSNWIQDGTSLRVISKTDFNYIELERTDENNTGIKFTNNAGAREAYIYINNTDALEIETPNEKLKFPETNISVVNSNNRNIFSYISSEINISQSGDNLDLVNIYNLKNIISPDGTEPILRYFKSTTPKSILLGNASHKLRLFNQNFDCVLPNASSVPFTTHFTNLVGDNTTNNLSNKTLIVPKLMDASTNYNYFIYPSSLSADRNITFPLLISNDTIVCESHIQNLSNKTLIVPRLLDASTSFRYFIYPSSLSADRNITFPLLLSNDTLVCESHIQNLSNKTLLLPKIKDASGSYNYNIITSTLSASRNITFPLLLSNDTLVCESHIQTLTQKTLIDAKVNKLLNNSNSREILSYDNTHFIVNINHTASSDLTYIYRSNYFEMPNQKRFFQYVAASPPTPTKIIIGNEVSKIDLYNINALMTFPTTSTTLIGTNTTDTLTNKTLTAPVVDRLVNLLGQTIIEYDNPNQKFNINALTNTHGTYMFNAQDFLLPNQQRLFEFVGAVGTTNARIVMGNHITTFEINSLFCKSLLPTTAPSNLTTLVGNNTTDTLENKTLTLPKMDTIKSVSGASIMSYSSNTITLGSGTTEQVYIQYLKGLSQVFTFGNRNFMANTTPNQIEMCNTADRVIIFGLQHFLKNPSNYVNFASQLNSSSSKHNITIGTGAENNTVGLTGNVCALTIKNSSGAHYADSRIRIDSVDGNAPVIEFLNSFYSKASYIYITVNTGQLVLESQAGVKVRPAFNDLVEFESILDQKFLTDCDIYGTNQNNNSAATRNPMGNIYCGDIFYENSYGLVMVASTKLFRIQHPVDDKKTLIHNAIESPRCDNIYSGKVKLVNGKANINMDNNDYYTMTDGTFLALNKDFRIYCNNNENFDRVIGKLKGNILEIICENTNSNVEINWMVIGTRQDETIKRLEFTDDNGNLIVETNEITKLPNVGIIGNNLTESNINNARWKKVAGGLDSKLNKFLIHKTFCECMLLYPKYIQWGYIKK